MCNCYSAELPHDDDDDDDDAKQSGNLIWCMKDTCAVTSIH